MSLDSIRSDFPLLKRNIRDGHVVYLDSAASTLKPQRVIDKITDFYTNLTANVHRGAHFVSDEATAEYEKARLTIKDFINAKSTNEVIFTRGTTESLNLVASSLGSKVLQPGDVILLSEMEHHSNIVPWQMIAEKMQAKIKVIPVDDQGDLIIEEFHRLIKDNVKIMSVTVCSNTLGTVNPVKDMIKVAKDNGAYTVLDAAQSISFEKTDVQDLGCDFLAFSAHKLFGPFGFGVLYGKEEILNDIPPYQGGGSMISKVTFEKTTYLNAPHRFEAGTPHVAGAVGTAEAILYLNQYNWDAIKGHEKQMMLVAEEQLKEISGLKFIGQSKSKVNIVSFVIEGTHPSDIGSLLDQQNIAVRTGHHCTQPLMDRYQIPGTVRASFSIYNNHQDVQKFVESVRKAKEMLI